MFESHIQQVAHKLQICDGSTGHSVKNIAFVDDVDRAKDMANKLNSYAQIVNALEVLLADWRSTCNLHGWDNNHLIGHDMAVGALKLTKGGM